MADSLETDDEAAGAPPDLERIDEERIDQERMNLAPQPELSPEGPDAPVADDAGRGIGYPRIAIVLAPIIVVAGLIRWLCT